MQRKEMSEVEMREFSEDVVPLLEKICEMARANNIESSLRIGISDDYVSLEGSGLCGWALSKYNGEYEIKYEKRVALRNKG